jgi:hypothetical protein
MKQARAETGDDGGEGQDDEELDHAGRVARSESQV